MSVDRTLHHFPLDPFSRQARLALGEKRLAFTEVVQRYWERPEGLAALNASGLLPVLVETPADGHAPPLVVCETRALLEYLEEAYPEAPLLPRGAADRAEARRLAQWFDRKFDNEVDALLLHEKMEKRLLGLGAPDLAALRAGRDALRWHLGYLEDLLLTRDGLAGTRISHADIAAAAHLSVIDYVGEVKWDDHPAVKSWYTRLKSRPAFRPLLADRQPGLPAAPHYDDLDF